MGGTQRLAAVAAISHTRHNYTTNNDLTDNSVHYGVNVFFVTATLCGVIIAVCAVCWRRAPSADKPDDGELPSVYTISGDHALQQYSNARSREQSVTQEEPPGPPPAYDTVVHDVPRIKDDELHEVITESCDRCRPVPPDVELPSYEAAVLLKDTKL